MTIAITPTTHSKTTMRREIEEIPHAVERLLSNGQKLISATAGQIRQRDVRFLLSVARGSSDHACSYLKYASELLLQLPMASMGPSVASLYNRSIHANNTLCIAISQSGKSPDIVDMVRATANGGAFTVAITNDNQSPLAQAVDASLPLYSGKEVSVAATKTFITSIVTGLWLLAEIKGDEHLRMALFDLPARLEKAIQNDWSPAASALAKSSSLFTLGRGPSWAISNEAALKLKETCQIHAESYSSAEVLHGPVSIVGKGFPVIGFATEDATGDSLVEVCDNLALKGANVFVSSSKARQAVCLPSTRTNHWLTDPLAIMVTFYAMVEQLAATKGMNPDTPRHLNKVTETV